MRKIVQTCKNNNSLPCDRETNSKIINMIPNNLIITRLMKIYSKKIYDNKKVVVY